MESVDHSMALAENDKRRSLFEVLIAAELLLHAVDWQQQQLLTFEQQSFVVAFEVQLFYIKQKITQNIKKNANKLKI